MNHLFAFKIKNPLLIFKIFRTIINLYSILCYIKFLIICLNLLEVNIQSIIVIRELNILCQWALDPLIAGIQKILMLSNFYEICFFIFILILLVLHHYVALKIHKLNENRGVK
jgi:hypothetical protein